MITSKVQSSPQSVSVNDLHPNKQHFAMQNIQCMDAHDPITNPGCVCSIIYALDTDYDHICIYGALGSFSCRFSCTALLASLSGPVSFIIGSMFVA